MFLNENGVSCVNLNGDMPTDVRAGRFDQFQRGFVDVLSCTDVASRGLDTIRVTTITTLLTNWFLFGRFFFLCPILLGLPVYSISHYKSEILLVNCFKMPFKSRNWLQEQLPISYLNFLPPLLCLWRLNKLKVTIPQWQLVYNTKGHLNLNTKIVFDKRDPQEAIVIQPTVSWFTPSALDPCHLRVSQMRRGKSLHGKRGRARNR